MPSAMSHLSLKQRASVAHVSTCAFNSLIGRMKSISGVGWLMNKTAIAENAQRTRKETALKTMTALN
jgi:hypothetical protein